MTNGGSSVPTTPYDEVKFHDAMAMYHQAGWRDGDSSWLIKLPLGHNYPPERQRTGRNGCQYTVHQIETMCFAMPGCATTNVGMRMPPRTVGIDTDVRHNGHVALAVVEIECGKLPETTRSNARGDEGGIRLYSIPPDIELTTGFAGVDFIQWHHRFVACWPSVRFDLGWATYRWSEGIPLRSELPPLPQGWIERFGRARRDDRPDYGPATEGELDAWLDAHDTGEEWKLLDRRVEFYRESLLDGRNPHDASLGLGLFGGVVEAAEGLFPARAALERMLEVFVEISSMSDRKTPEARWRSEFEALFLRATRLYDHPDATDQQRIERTRERLCVAPELVEWLAGLRGEAGR